MNLAKLASDLFYEGHLSMAERDYMKEMQRRIDELEAQLRVNDDYITALKTGHGWVSVDDELPSRAASQRVLVYSPERGAEYGYWSGDYFHGESGDITHWMPLPPAPEGGQDG